MKSFVLIAALTASFLTVAQVDRSVRPKPAQAATIDIKDAQQFTLPNGITVLVSENHKLPRISCTLTMGASPRLEGAKAGASSMLGSLLMSGTTNRPKVTLDKEIDFIGASINASFNSVSLSCLKKHLNRGMDLMTDVLMHPAFDQAEFEKIKSQTKDNLNNSKTSPESMAENVGNSVNFPGHPYGEIMDEASLAAITIEDVMMAYKNDFTPNGSYLVLVGDISLTEARELTSKMFAAWEGNDVSIKELPKMTAGLGNRVIFVKKPGAVQSVINITFPLNIKPGSKDELALKVMNGILGGGSFGSRFFQNLREDKAWTYGAYTDLSIDRNGSSLSASGSFRNEVSDSAIVEMLKEFKRITEDYVTDEELNLTKAAMAGSFARSMESPSTIASFSLNILRNKLDKEYYRGYLKRLEAISKDDVLDAAQKYMVSGYNIVVVGSEEVLPKLKVFDTDGKIELLDAFGNEVKEMKKADISAENLIQNYINAVTLTSNAKKLKKKLKKVKSVVKTVELSSAQIPIKITLTEVNVLPMKEAQRIEAQGQVFQSSYFDGQKGSNTAQGNTVDFTAEEITEKQKRAGLFPEMNFVKNGVLTEVKGIEVIDGKDYYVLSSKAGEFEQLDYYDAKTFLKYKSVSFQKQGEEVVESAFVFSDYKEINGFMFPHQTEMGGGGMTFKGAVQKIEVNGKIDQTWFK
jgi:zinc protease